MTPHNFAVSNLSTSHLTDDQLDEVLLGIASQPATAHLAVCDPCTQRFVNFQAGLQAQMSAFNQASLAWSEARSNTISRDIRRHKSTPRVTLPAVWSAASALVLAAIFTVNAGLQRTPGSLESANTAATISSPDAVHPEHSQFELASDNAMLDAIDSEMGTPQPSQFGILQNTNSSIASQQADAAVQVRD